MDPYSWLVHQVFLTMRLWPSLREPPVDRKVRLRMDAVAAHQYPKRNQQLLALALGISLCAHYWLLSVLSLSDWGGITSTTRSQMPSKTLRLKLLTRAEPTSQISDSSPRREARLRDRSARPTAAPAITILPNSDRTPVVPAPSATDSAKPGDAPLNLSLPPDSAIEETELPYGGKIFDPTLITALEAERSKQSTYQQQPQGLPRTLVGNSDFSDGSWLSYVQVDKLCFRVIEADPLNSLSREQWYPIRCE